MDAQFLIQLVIVLLVAGLLWFAVQRAASLLPPPIPLVIEVLIILFFCVWLLNSVGVFGTGHLRIVN